MTNFQVTIIREVLDVAQLIQCLSSMHKVLGYIQSSTYNNYFELSLQSQHSGQSMRIRSSRLSSATHQVQAQLSYMKPCLSRKKKKEIIRNITLVSVLGALSQRAGPCMKLKSSCSSNSHSTKRPGHKGME